jgi:H+/Cl- antiporter ClcA
VAIGALLGIVIGRIWNFALPDTPSGAFAVLGATAFLASSTKMPMTAIVLMVEFTHVDHDFLIPILFAVAGSTSASSLCNLRAESGNRHKIMEEEQHTTV